MHRLLIPLLSAVLISWSPDIEQIPTATNPYPSNPAENFAPSLVADGTYKNLALHRRAYASSSWDYSLTAQLATDGIIEHQQPAHFVLSTSRGLVPRVEREWIFDLKTNTSCELNGTDDYFQIDLNNYQLDFDKLQLMCRVQASAKQEKYFGVPGQEDGAIHPVKRAEQQRHDISWTVIFLGSVNGKSWKTLDTVHGVGDAIYTSLSKRGTYSHYRLAFSSPQAEKWTVTDCDFFHAGDDVVRVLGTRTEVHRRDKAVLLTPPFSSAWMSEGSGQQWIYVDLGTSASIDHVKLHWLSKAPKGTLQVSDDAVSWRDVAALKPDMRLSAKARYVRLMLHSGGPYILSEFEVYGKDGVAVKPKAQPAPNGNRVDLAGGNWRLQRASLVSADGTSLSSADYDDSQWIVATVPATILTSYINAGAVPDPNYSDNQLHISDSYFLSDFWYRNTFTLPRGFARDKVFLNFDGINWKAEIYLNGQQIGRIDGAFIRGQFEVSKLLREGDNHLAVKILRNSLPGAIKEQTAESTGSNGGVIGADNPTFHASVGWDWIPTIRGRNTGIWNDVYLTTTGQVQLRDPFVRTELNLPAPAPVRSGASAASPAGSAPVPAASPSGTPATIFIEATLCNHSDHPVSGVLTGTFGETPFSTDVTLAAGESRLVRLDSFHLDNPRLWWPAGYGSPELYDTHMAFVINGQTSDEVSFKTGVRQMTYSIDSIGALNLYVNGRRFIGRGGNWGFAESNLAYRGREYDISVRYHADQNFTMIRNWVGQVGDEEFYEACDRHGVMVWQDFWLANPWDGPDPYDEAMFMANAEDYVKRIRNHASIGLYCGRNEGMPPASLDAALRQLVVNEHPGLHYISHSAANEVSGGGPYRALPVSQYFDLFGPDRFHSERGMPCFMNYEHLAATMPSDSLYPHNSLWGMHDFTLTCAQYGSTFLDLMQQGFGDISDARTFCKYAQWINYNGYRAMFEGRSKHRQGLLLWMSHPAWPSLVWQTYDYFFEPTAAYFGCKKASEPLHVQYNPLTKHVEVVNMSGGNRQQLDVVAQVLDLSGKVVWQQQQTVASPEDCTQDCMPVTVPADITDVYFIRLCLSDAGTLISENFYWQGREDGNYQALRTLPAADLRVSTDISAPVSRTVESPSSCAVTSDSEYVATTTITNTSSVPALMLRLKLMADDGTLILPAVYSDNYLSLMPGETKTVTTHFSAFDLRGRTAHIEVE